MTNKIDWKSMLRPAIYVCEASGREHNPCLICNKAFNKGEKIAEYFSGAFKSRASYTNRLCYKCFIKVLLHNFYEDLEDEQIKKEVVIEMLK